jgi:hypothetical protein
VASRAEHLVVALDSSASMGASVDGEPVSARAVALVRARIAALARGSRVTVVRSGPRPSLVAGPAAFPAEASAALDAWRPLAASHDLAPAVALALQFAGGARVTLVSDHHEPERWPETIELVSLGKPLGNWALTHAARTRERAEDGGEQERVFVTLTSFAREERSLTVRALAGAQELVRREETLAPGARAHFAFTLPEGVGPVEVRLDADAFTLDDAVLLAPPPRRVLALAAELTHEELALLGLSAGADGGIERWLELVEHSIAAPSAASAHLVLAHARAAPPQAWTLVLDPLGSARRDLIGPFLAERTSALLEGMTLEGSVWSVDPALVLPGAPVVSAGNDPILTAEQLGTRTDWHLNLDPARSSLQRSPDWPILLVNLAERRREALPGPARTNLGVGERFVHRPGDELAGVVRGERLDYELAGPLATPLEATRTVPALEEVVLDGLEEPGLYRLSFAGRPVAEFAVHFSDAAESDLGDALPGVRAAGQASAALVAELSPVELALIVLVLLAITLDWWALARVRGRTSG